MAEAPLIGKREMNHDGPVIRLLVCLECKTIDELPPHEGPPETDLLLEMTAEKHEYPSGDRHKGKLFILPVKTWANPAHQKEIIKQLTGGGSSGLDAMTPEGDYYSTKMQFAEDAMQCYKYHLRPTNHCDDYQSESKRLLPKTSKERKDLGLPDPKNAPGMPKVYLCNFCPMHSVMTQKRRSLMGMYD